MSDLESLHTWQLEVTGQLGKLIATVEGLAQNVDRQTSSVAKLWKSMDEASRDLAALKANPAMAQVADLGARVANLEAESAARKAARESAARTSARWAQWVRPVVMLAIGSGLTLLGKAVWKALIG
ncbi:MAG TPA: hypothetical protein VN736_28740 [Candidatus Limnocylindrales bacterium]|nr:hypothetical protein [Candidatus Limnocylindrales bacterium]